MILRALVVSILGAVLFLVEIPAHAATLHPIVVSDNPSDDMPVLVATVANPEPHVDDFGQIGDMVFAGGLFDRVAIPGQTPTYSRTNFMTFNASTGILKSQSDSNFVDPIIDGQVWAIETFGNSVYIGGEFATVNGVTRKRLVKIDAVTGAVDTTFNAKLPGGIVWDLKMWPGPDGNTPRLIVSSSTKNRLMALDPVTGNDTGYINLGIADPIPNAWGDLSTYKIAINPAGTKLVATGNFLTVGGQSRSRMFVANLTGAAATLDPWYYPGFAKPCTSTAPRRIAYLQGVDFSPDGSYFIITATGQIPKFSADIWPTGSATYHTVCDAAARFNMNDDTRPAWINYTGGDSVWVAAATGAAVYVQGHFQWLDNPFGFASRDGGGASPRFGIGAIDPVTGRALPWAPVKRTEQGGKGLLATSTGLWVGSDSPMFDGEPHLGLGFVPLQDPQWEIKLDACLEGDQFVVKTINTLPAIASCSYSYPAAAGALLGELSANQLLGTLKSKAQGHQTSLSNRSSIHEKLRILGDWTGTIPVTVSMRFTAQVSGDVQSGPSGQAVSGKITTSNSGMENSAQFIGNISGGSIQRMISPNDLVGTGEISLNAPIGRTVDLTLKVTAAVSANDPFVTLDTDVSTWGASTSGALETSASQGAISILLPADIGYRSLSGRFLGDPAPTHTVVSSSPNPSVFGEVTSLTATVFPTTTTGPTPTGSVIFYDGPSVLGSANLLDGSGSLPVATMPVGDHNISATYIADPDFLSSSSPAITHTVNAAATSTVLSASENPTTIGDPVSFTATVSAMPPGSGTPSGLVLFKEGAVELATAALTGTGEATYSTIQLPVGDHIITAQYLGDNGFKGSSGNLTQFVRAVVADSTVDLLSRPNPSLFGQAVNMEAIVAGNGNGAPTGSVTFKDGNDTIGTGTVETIGIRSTIGAGLGHTCAVGHEGGVQCWGSNAFGQLGSVSPTSSSVPINVAGLEGVTEVVSGEAHTCALLDMGSVSCWGSNADSQLGDGTSTDHSAPAEVLGLANVRSIASGAFHTCALTDAGGVKCWGKNGYGQLGEGSFSNQNVPVDVAGLTSDVKAIAAGEDHTCALKNTGQVSCWGYNVNGELGTGQLGNLNTPGSVLGLDDPVIAVTAGNGYTCVLTANRSVLCWGANGNGQLGDGTLIDRYTPDEVSTLSNGVAALSAGRNHTCAAMGDGAVKCWGSNSGGQLGNGTTANSSVPVNVLGLSNVSVLAAGGQHTCAVMSDGTGGCWGANSAGQVGDGTNTNSTVPVAVGGLAAQVFGRTSLTTSGLVLGSHNIVATYTGNESHHGSSSDTLIQGVQQASTATEVVSSNGSSAFGEQLAFTATVSVLSPSQGIPTGTVTLYDGAVVLGGPVGLDAGGAATFSISLLSVGNHEVSAVFSGDTNFTSSVSPTTIQKVRSATTVTTVESSDDSAFYGQQVDFVATVSVSAPGSGTPTGTVTFMDGDIEIASDVGVDGSGVAAFSTSTLSIGTHNIQAVYHGDESLAGSTSLGIAELVTPASTVTTVESSLSPSSVGQSVTFTATVGALSPGAGVPLGNVTFRDGLATLGVAPLTGNGQANFATSTLAVGRRSISAVYSGDSNFATSTSGTILQEVGRTATTTSAVVTPLPSLPHQSVQIAATVAPALGNGTPAGTVTFMEGTTTLGQATLSNGVAVLDIASALEIGAHSVSVSYGGDDVWASSSTVTTVNVDPRVGPEFVVNSEILNTQMRPSAGRLINGDLIIVWQSDGQDSSGFGVYGQRYDAGGTKLGTEFRVNTKTIGSQYQPSVTELKDGGFVVTWTSDGQDGYGLGVYAQRFSAAGTKIGLEFRVNTKAPGDQSLPSVRGLLDGGFFVAWIANDLSGLGIYGQRFNNVGAKVGQQFRINSKQPGNQSLPSVAALENGGFVVTWASDAEDGSGMGVYGQRYDSAGLKVAGQFRINTTTVGNQSSPSVAGLLGGGFVVTWVSDGEDGSGLGVYGQRYGATGAKTGGQFRVNTTTVNDQDRPSVAGFQDGGFVVVWASRDQAAPGWDVYSQSFDPQGRPAEIEIRVNSTVDDNQWQPSVTAFDKGRFLAAWTSMGHDGSLEGVYGQRFDLNR